MSEFITNVPHEAELKQIAHQQALDSAQDTDPNLIPHVVNVAEQTGLDPSIFEKENLRLHDVAQSELVIDVKQAGDIDGKGLIGIVEMGNSAVRIYGYKENGEYVPGAFTLAPGKYEEPPEEERDWARKVTLLAVAHDKETVVGRATPGGQRLGLDSDDQVSRKHFSTEITPDGKLVIKDFESTNGTSVITAEKEQPKEDLNISTVREMGTLATSEYLETPQSKERVIDGVSFRLDGAIPERGREAYAFTTNDSEGKSRKFFVYRSGSEGALRVSQGIEKTPRGGIFMKGNPLSPDFQYTQDTQLHPEFAQALESMVIENKSDMPFLNFEDYEYERAGAESLMQDFGNNIETSSFQNPELAKDLKKLDANNFSKYKLAESFDIEDWKDIDPAFKTYINRLNNELEQSGVIPDFSKPEKVEVDIHPSLGQVIHEVFTHRVDNRAYEWHMSRDSQGRVWIDRIRYPDAEISAYGTDKQVVYSGILTSKPIDYHEQTTGIPDEYVEVATHGSYSDISRFLDTLAPVQRYRAQRNIKHEQR